MDDKNIRILRHTTRAFVRTVMHVLAVGTIAFGLAYVLTPSAYAWKCF